MRLLLFVVALAFGVSVAYSRFILGMHSLDQILFGILLGLWLAVSFHTIGYEALENHCKALWRDKYFVLDTKGKFTRLSLITLAVFVVLLALEIMNYLTASSSTIPDVWVTNLNVTSPIACST